MVRISASQHEEIRSRMAGVRFPGSENSFFCFTFLLKDMCWSGDEIKEGRSIHRKIKDNSRRKGKGPQLTGRRGCFLIVLHSKHFVVTQAPLLLLPTDASNTLARNTLFNKVFVFVVRLPFQTKSVDQVFYFPK